MALAPTVFLLGIDIIVSFDDASLMRYSGGKGKTYQHVINTMPPHRVYIETHLGGGAVMRHKRPASRNVGLDIDPRVLDGWSREPLPHVEVLAQRAEDFLRDYSFVGDELVYADPPYFPTTRKRARVYRHDYSAGDHERLLGILKALPCMVVLSGYANELYEAQLVGWQTYSFRAKTHSGIREERLWCNFDRPEVLHDARYLGADFHDRQAVKRRLLRLKERISRMPPAERAAIHEWIFDQHLGRREGKT